MTRINQATVAIVMILLIASCTTVKPGQVAVKQRFGKLVGEPKTEGLIAFNPFVTKVIKASAQRMNLKLDIQLHSKEGLSVKASISILYHIDKTHFNELFYNYGLEYEPIITAIFRSVSSADCAQFFVMYMHYGNRLDIEVAICER